MWEASSERSEILEIFWAEGFALWEVDINQAAEPGLWNEPKYNIKIVNVQTLYTHTYM